MYFILFMNFLSYVKLSLAISIFCIYFIPYPLAAGLYRLKHTHIPDYNMKFNDSNRLK